MLTVRVVVQKDGMRVQLTKTHALHVVSGNLQPLFFAYFFTLWQP
jgi:hypothetical protein